MHTVVVIGRGERVTVDVSNELINTSDRCILHLKLIECLIIAIEIVDNFG